MTLTKAQGEVLISPKIEELEKQYRWKAENIVRFLEKLKMTPKQKVDFVANELATAYWLGTIRRLEWPDAGRKAIQEGR